MKSTIEHIQLRLKHPFTISRGSSEIKHCIIVQLEHEGISGYGEAAPSGRYDETEQTVHDFLRKVNPAQFPDPFQVEDMLNYVQNISTGNAAAKAAIDIALHDWIGKKLGIPLWKLFGLNKEKTPLTSFTIGIDSLDIIEQKVKEAEPFPVLKVKVGIPGDEDIVKMIRTMTGKIIRVDANEGWKSKEIALDKILRFEEQGVELVEQPLPSGQLEETVWLRERVHVPLIADESLSRSADVYRVRDAFDGINIKLMKCGGIREAQRMINTARALGLKIMLGCMIESSVGISAAAQLSPLVDYADLDGNLLISNDPFDGVKITNGRPVLNDSPGIGIERKD